MFLLEQRQAEGKRKREKQTETDREREREGGGEKRNKGLFKGRMIYLRNACLLHARCFINIDSSDLTTVLLEVL